MWPVTVSEYEIKSVFGGFLTCIKHFLSVLHKGCYLISVLTVLYILKELRFKRFCYPPSRTKLTDFKFSICLPTVCVMFIILAFVLDISTMSLTFDFTIFLYLCLPVNLVIYLVFFIIVGGIKVDGFKIFVFSFDYYVCLCVLCIGFDF